MTIVKNEYCIYFIKIIRILYPYIILENISRPKQIWVIRHQDFYNNNSGKVPDLIQELAMKALAMATYQDKLIAKPGSVSGVRFYEPSPKGLSYIYRIVIVYS